MTQKIILLNGPISSGKDVLGTYLEKHLPESKTLMFKDSLYDWCSAMAALPREVFIELATNRDTKEAPCSLLPRNHLNKGGYFSPRQWLIHVSEKVIKPRLGPDFFGKQAASSVSNAFFQERTTTAIFTDSGFLQETLALAKHFKSSASILLVHIHRPGYGFGPNDSRGYVDVKDHNTFECKVTTVRLDNNTTLEEFLAAGLSTVQMWSQLLND